MAQDAGREGRFNDTARGQAIGAGLSGSTALPDTFTAKDTVRNLQPFKKFGVPLKKGKKPGRQLRAFKGKTDTQIENIAANAIVRKAIKNGSVKRTKLRTGFNYKKFNRRQIARAKRVMDAESPSAKARKQTQDARNHIKFVRRNRIVMKTPLFSQNV